MAGAQLLVVYGTLRTGTGWRERIGVDGLVTPVGACTIRGSLYDLGWYPGLVLDGSGPVAAEVVRLEDPDALVLLDRFEGYDPDRPEESEYRRVRVDVAPGHSGARGERAWVYELDRPVDPEQRIDGGDWLVHLATRSGRRP